MKTTFKLLALILSIIMFIEVVPVGAVKSLFDSNDGLISSDLFDDSEALFDNQAFESAQDEADILSELTSERMSDVKKFRMSDGTTASVSYPIDVHFVNGNGEYVQIDNSPEDGFDEGDEVIDATKDNVFEAKFMKESKEDKIYTLTYGDTRIKVSINGSAPSEVEDVTLENKEPGMFDVANITGSYQYTDILDNTDIRYTVVSKDLKENIILKDRVEFDSIEYVYETDEGVEFVQIDEQTVEIRRDDETIAEIKAPSMWDSKGEFCCGVSLTLGETNEGSTAIILSWDDEWANDEERVYPVTVDPYIITKVNYVGATDIVDDVYAVENNPTSTQYSYYEMMGVGHSNYHGIVRSVIKIAFEDTIPDNANIVSANLNLIPFTFDPVLFEDFPSETYINLYKMTSSWSESSFCWNTFWSSNPSNGFDSKVVDYVHVVNCCQNAATNNSLFSWDISKIAREWIEGASPNYGIMLAYNDETMSGITYLASADWIYASSHASDAARPNLTIQYLDTNGLEDYYSYISASAGRAGAAYVNKMAGNLTAINNILLLGSGPVPINLSLVYNSNDSSETDAYPLGRGWRINYSQSIELTDQTYLTTGRRYFKYVDDDGTARYFLENTANGYDSTDEIDEKNKLTYNSSTHEFTLSSDNSGTKLKFGKSGSSWYLNSIIDEYGNSITLTHGTSFPHIVTKIESSDGYSVNLNYNSVTFLTSVTYTDVTSKTIQIGYAGGSAVKSITYEDGKTVNYGYVSGTHRLNKMTDTDGYSLEFTYTGGSGNIPLRVSGITEKGSNGTVRNQATMTYGLRSMTLTDVTNERTYLNTFTSGGTTLSTVDVTADTNDAYAMYYEYNNGSSDIKNKDTLTFVSQTQKSTVNLLYDHSFEGTSGQSFTVWDAPPSSAASASYSTEKAHLGTHSVKLDIPSADDTTRVLSYSVNSLTAGKEYTFSAYVNTSEMTSVTGGASLFIYYSSGGNTRSYESEAFTEITGTGEWKRIFVTFTPEFSGNTSICLSLSKAEGSVYFDNIQLEEGGLSEYNLIDNAGFSANRSWTYQSPASYSSTGGFGNSGSGKVSGDPSLSGAIYQTVNVSGASGDVYVLSALAKAYSVGTPQSTFAVSVKFMNGGAVVNEKKIDFSRGTDVWQKAAGQAISDGAYTSIRVYLLYDNGANTAYFDNVQLIKDYFGNTYTYDSKGNITSTKDLANTEENTFTYDGNSQLIQQTNIDGSNITYAYNGTKIHQLDSVTASDITTSFSYDSFGNAITAKARNTDSTKTVSSGAAYNSKGDMTSSVDSLGNMTSYFYREGLVKEATDASGAKVVNEYNSSRFPTSSTFVKDSTERTVGYTYNSNNYLTGITAPGGTSYGFTYDEFGRELSTTVGNTTLSTNTYNNKGLLTERTYGNAATYSYTYDSLNRPKEVSTGPLKSVTYSYDGKGRISEEKDSFSGRTTKTEYDLLDRTSEVRVFESNELIQTSAVRYDDKNRVEGIDYTYSGATKSTDYVYGDTELEQEPSVIYGVDLNNSSALTYTYDDLLRTTKKTINSTVDFETEYTYSSGKKIYDGGYYSAYYEGRCVCGDFNGDTFADLAVMYRYSSTQCKIFVWESDGNGGYKNPEAAFESVDGNPYDASKVTGRMICGDFDGDGSDEIAAFYDLGSNNIALHVFKYSNGTFTKTVPYTAATPGTFHASRFTNRVTAGDYDGDDEDEIAIMYDYGSSLSKILVFKYNSSYTAMSYSIWYDSGSGNYDANAVTGRFVSGDFDGDGKDEIAAMYDASGGSSAQIHVFKKSGNNNSFTKNTWYTVPGGSILMGSRAEGTLTAGNFTGDAKDDLAFIYDYTNTANVLVFESTGNQFGSWVYGHLGSNNYTFSGMQYRVFSGNTDNAGYDEMIALYKPTSSSLSIVTFENNSSTYFDYNNRIWNSQTIAEENDDATSTRVAAEKIGADTYTYTYDVLGNITEIKKNGNAFKTYEYDDLGELISEHIEGKQKTVYTYDNGGNITSSTKYLYVNGVLQSTGTVTTYGYNDTSWRDLLTSYDNQSITYDAMGNPTSYLGNTLSWSDVRRLSSVGNTATYTYDFSGIRTAKTAGGVTHEYLLDGSKIICEKRSDGITLHFFYDASGNIFAFEYDDDMYYYVRNILGEILGIIDTDGSYVVKYTYDAWGKPLAITDGAGIDVSANSSHIANINPFRYKGYYFDTETGFYYLQSRYYDPTVGRFINADSFVSTGTGFLGYNMFAYCNNCPVMLKDEYGCIPVFSSSFEEETDEQRKEAVEYMKKYTNTRYKVFKENSLKKEFNSLYEATFGEKYPISDYSITYEVVEVKTSANFSNAMLSILVPLGISNIDKLTAELAGIHPLLAASGILLGAVMALANVNAREAGKYPTYTITVTTYTTAPVEIANYHGYIICENRDFACITCYEYYVLNGELKYNGSTSKDEYLAYRYRNHP